MLFQFVAGLVEKFINTHLIEPKVTLNLNLFDPIWLHLFSPTHTYTIMYWQHTPVYFLFFIFE